MSKIPIRSAEARAQIAERIAKLEQKNEALVRRIVALVKRLSGSLGHDHVLTADAIKTRRVEIVDAEGIVRITLSSTSDRAEIAVFDEFGQSVIVLGHYNRGRFEDGSADIPGRTLIQLADGTDIETIDPEWSKDQLDGVACGICGSRGTTMQTLYKIRDIEILCCYPDCPSS